VEAVVAPLSESSQQYRFCFTQPCIDAVVELQRKRVAIHAEMSLENATGCARTEGIQAVVSSGGSGRITRALVRSAEEVGVAQPTSRKGEDKAKSDRSLMQAKYKAMKATPIEHRLVARRSHIHGWGLFTKRAFDKDDAIVEYVGEIINQPVGDRREKAYEVSGEGSCYMFRLDMQRIVDATTTGSMARFMNHCCDPNSYAKIIQVDTEQGPDKKIVVFARRDINMGEEITYGAYHVRG
jgi:SET domain